MILDKDISWDSIPELIEREVANINRTLNQFPFIKEKINTDALEKNLMGRFISMVHKAELHGDKENKLKSRLPKLIVKYTHFCEDLAEFSKLIDNEIDANSDQEQIDRDRIRKEWLKFKQKYMLWARNLIAMFNTIKIRDNANWLDVRSLANTLAEIEMVEAHVSKVVEYFMGEDNETSSWFV